MPYTERQKRPDPKLPVPGVPGSRATFFLRETPRVFTVLTAGQSNQDFQIAAVQAVERQEVPLPSRRFTGARPSGQTITFDIAIAGVGTVTPNWAGTVPLEAGIAGSGSVSPGLTKTARLAAAITGTGSLAASLAGGTIAGQLDLEAEVSTGLTLTPEGGDGLTLTPESSDSLDLTPEE